MRVGIVRFAILGWGIASGCSFLVDDSPSDPANESDANPADLDGFDARPGSPDSAISGSDGGMAVLTDRGLVARYFIDEGSSSIELIDSALNPLNVPLTKAGGLDYGGTGGHLGLLWPDVGADGRADLSASGTKLGDLHQGKVATLEVVAFVQATGDAGAPSALLHLGKSGFEGALSMWVHTGTKVTLGFQDKYVAEWDVPAIAVGSTVLHIVLDSDAGLAADRARLYANGVRVVADDVLDEFNGAIIFIAGNARFVVGNDGAGGRSVQGHVGYAAVYGDVLSEGEIAGNAAALAIRDDAP